ncbi:trichothecene 3-O-acetyltransferase [Schizosaccharomyces japonicus yFS275]|uniref:Trichothecene 3-O-acetyltransferase n=1 Tax=Schizosaccharomyces japonicus (strain yFS275 / FY16936) TaxID=402676 RepID=B6K0H0_SCHJY|nr:trichothecene 3-O-acetyltransferase [Schizosaccharomyces japonicus yFS275]EEB06320.1 trichothecene 3-O-acetyltransferase [Schizosaccharomyces japonicus yFS275]
MSVLLDIFGQFPLTICVPLCLFYEVKDPSSYPLMVQTMKDGLQRLSAAFPWIAGKVIIEGVNENCTGIRKIKLIGKIPLIIKDLRDDPSVPTMDEFRKTRFPMASIKEKVVAPYSFLPHLRDGNDPDTDSDPVFSVQMNFINGGLLLTCIGHHSVMDMTGETKVMHLLSKACHNEPFSSEELRIGNLDRQTVFQKVTEPFDPEVELVNQLTKVKRSFKESVGEALLKYVPSTWKCFLFERDSLDALKALASESISESTSFVSTDDSLTAFVFRAIIRARFPRLNPSTELSLVRCVNVRDYLGIHPDYLGNALHQTYCSWKAESVVKAPVGSIASRLRSAIKPSELARQTLILGTYLDGLQDKSTVSYSANLDATETVMLSSWAKMKSFDLDFNFGLGTPEVERFPQCIPVEGLVYFLHRGANGEIPVSICLRNEDMERLKADKEFTKYGVYIG